MAVKIKTGPELTWKWILVVVGLTFLGVYLLNNIKPAWIQPYTPAGWQQVSPEPLPSDMELVPLGEEEEYYEEEFY